MEICAFPWKIGRSEDKRQKHANILTWRIEAIIRTHKTENNLVKIKQCLSIDKIYRSYMVIIANPLLYMLSKYARQFESSGRQGPR